MASFIRITLNGGYEEKINLDTVKRVFYSEKEKYTKVFLTNDCSITYIEGTGPTDIKSAKVLFDRF